MTNKEIKNVDINFSFFWKVSEILFQENNFLCLITFSSKLSSKIMRSRYDMGKRVFIDAIPPLMLDELDGLYLEIDNIILNQRR